MEKEKIQKGTQHEQVLYTVSEVATLLKVNINYVYTLIRKDLLKALKLGNMKITKKSLYRFLDEIDGKDLSDLDNITDLKVG